MDDVQASAGHLGPSDRPLDGFPLGHGRPREGVSPRAERLPVGVLAIALDEQVEQVDALGVDSDLGAQLGGQLETLIQDGVVGHPALLSVDHEHLEGRNAGVHDLTELPGHLVVPIREAEVERVVDADLRVGLCLARFDGREEGLTLAWMAKSMTVVTPPQAAALVPFSKSSALTVPPKGSCRWTCPSMAPGKTLFAP